MVHVKTKRLTYQKMSVLATRNSSRLGVMHVDRTASSESVRMQIKPLKPNILVKILGILPAPLWEEPHVNSEANGMGE